MSGNAKKFVDDPARYIMDLRDGQPEPTPPAGEVLMITWQLLRNLPAEDAVIFAFATGARLQKDGKI